MRILRKLIQRMLLQIKDKISGREEDIFRKSKRANLRKLLVVKIKEGMEKERER